MAGAAYADDDPLRLLGGRVGLARIGPFPFVGSLVAE